MAEYIERNAVLDLSDAFEICFDDGDEIYFEYIPVDEVKAIPSADVAPVRHGRWLHDGTPKEMSYLPWYCSECGEYVGKHQTLYCPWCGAKMDKEAGDGDV